LNEIGFVANVHDVPDLIADGLVIIKHKLDSLEKEKANKNGK
jgi:hypothetical protein